MWQRIGLPLREPLESEIEYVKEVRNVWQLTSSLLASGLAAGHQRTYPVQNVVRNVGAVLNTAVH